MEPFASYHVARVFCRSLLTFFGIRYSLEGRENLIGETKGQLLVAPLNSWLDPIILTACLPKTMFFLAGEQSGNLPLWGWVSRNLGSFHLRKGRSNKSHLKRIFQTIESGKNVIQLFRPGEPEESEQKYCRSYTAFVLNKTRTTLLPVSIIGSESILPFGSIIPKIHPVRVVIGKPETNSSTDSLRDRKEQISSIREWVSRKFEETSQLGRATF